MYLGRCARLVSIVFVKYELRFLYYTYNLDFIPN